MTDPGPPTPAPTSAGSRQGSPAGEHPVLAAARRVAADVLAPAAAGVDAGEVPVSHLRALADAGVLGLAGPVEAGGSAAPPAVVREVAEVLAGADCSTWLVQAQHHGPLAMLARADGGTPVRDRLLGPMATGRVVSGVAFSHLRRFPQRPVAVSRVEGGWRFDGSAPWYTGWGLNSVFVLAGATAAGEVVFAVADARSGPHLRASEPLRMAAMQATRTVRLALDGLVVPEGDVVARLPHAQWAEADRRTTANVNPACFGVARTAVRSLADRGEDAVAARLGERVETARAECYALLDQLPPEEGVEERLRAKATALRAMVDATTALVVAGAGRSMAAGAPAQRLAREALFLLVQGQTAEVRAATLEQWSRAGDRSGPEGEA